MSATDTLNGQQFAVSGSGEPSREAQLAEFRRFQTAMWSHAVAEDEGYHGELHSGTHYPNMKEAAKHEGIVLSSEEYARPAKGSDPHGGMLDIDPEHPGKLKRRSDPSGHYRGHMVSADERMHRRSQRVQGFQRTEYPS